MDVVIFTNVRTWVQKGQEKHQTQKKGKGEKHELSMFDLKILFSS